MILCCLKNEQPVNYLRVFCVVFGKMKVVISKNRFGFIVLLLLGRKYIANFACGRLAATRTDRLPSGQNGRIV